MRTPSILQFFTYAHLPPHLQAVSVPFAKLADDLVRSLPDNPERSEALRKLLEAKDCAVRAYLFKPEVPEALYDSDVEDLLVYLRSLNLPYWHEPYTRNLPSGAVLLDWSTGPPRAGSRATLSAIVSAQSLEAFSTLQGEMAVPRMVTDLAGREHLVRYWRQVFG